MAGAGGTLPPPPPPPPLRLKDLLELDCDSCSAAGFRCYPRCLPESSSSAPTPTPMRHLLESPSLRRRSSKLSHLSRSLSRRLSRRGGFWRRRDVEKDGDAAATSAAVTVTAASAAGCCGSSSSEELETSSESSDNSSGRARSESDSDFSSAATEVSVRHPSRAAGAGGEHEVAMKRASNKEGSSSGSEADDKEQLSPVAVMDFPFDDDDDEEELRLGDAGVACSPSFSLARLQRRKMHKIRRFGSGDELAPLDLEGRLATASDPDADGLAADDVPAQQQMIQCRTGEAATPTCAGSGHRGVHDVPDEDDDLTSLLMGAVSAGLDDASERLLLDFFVETKRRRSEAHAVAELPLPGPGAGGLRRKAERVVVDGEPVAAARGWLEGTGTERWGLSDVLSGGAAIVAEMERGRRWMQVGEEKREVCAVVAGMLADQLVSEVVRCLLL